MAILRFDDTYLNPDHIVSFEAAGRGTVVKMAEGDPIYLTTSCYNIASAIEIAEANVVKADPGYFILNVLGTSRDDKDYLFEKYPVVAWQILPNGLSRPVALSFEHNQSFDEAMAVLTPSGNVFTTEDLCRFDTIDEFVSFELEKNKERAMDKSAEASYAVTQGM